MRKMLIAPYFREIHFAKQIKPRYTTGIITSYKPTCLVNLGIKWYPFSRLFNVAYRVILPSAVNAWLLTTCWFLIFLKTGNIFPYPHLHSRKKDNSRCYRRFGFWVQYWSILVLNYCQWTWALYYCKCNV